MVCKTETTEIDEVEYSVTQWNVEKAMLMKFKLVKVFGPAFSVLISQNEESENQEILSSSLKVLFENNSPEEMVALIKSCLVGVMRDKKRLTETSILEVFSSGDDLITLYKVFFFVLKVNFGNLLKGQSVESLLASVRKN